MQSQYSIRLYELLKSYENMNGQIFEVIDLRKLLNLSDEVLADWFDFKRFVIERAIKEINKFTDIMVKYEPIKKGRKIFEVKFYVYTKSATDQVMAQRLIERTLDKTKKDEYNAIPF